MRTVGIDARNGKEKRAPNCSSLLTKGSTVVLFAKLAFDAVRRMRYLQ